MFKKLIILLLAFFLTGCMTIKEKYSFIYSIQTDSMADHGDVVYNRGLLILTPDKQTLLGGDLKLDKDTILGSDTNTSITRIRVSFYTVINNEVTNIYVTDIYDDKGFNLNSPILIPSQTGEILDDITIEQILNNLYLHIQLYNGRNSLSSYGIQLSLDEIAKIENK